MHDVFKPLRQCFDEVHSVLPALGLEQGINTVELL